MTAYLIFLVFVLLLSTAVYAARLRDARGAFLALPAVVLFGIIGAKLFYVLPMITSVTRRYGVPGCFFSGNMEEFSVFGGACGAVLAIAVTARWTKETDKRKALNAFAPAGAILLAGIRIGEYFLNPVFLGYGMIGLGDPLEGSEWYCFFPVAMADAWGMQWYAVFSLEAFLALLGALFSVTIFRGNLVFRRTVFFLAAGQLVTELFHCQSIAWGFVRLEQVCCALLMLLLIFCQCRQNKRFLPGVIACFLIMLLIFLEFEMDKGWIAGFLWNTGFPAAVTLVEKHALFCYIFFILGTGGLLTAWHFSLRE